MSLKIVPPHSAKVALEYVKAGGTLVVPSYTRTIVIDAKTLARFEKVGEWLLKEDGNGYRLRQGRGSVYLYEGLLKFYEE